MDRRKEGIKGLNRINSMPSIEFVLTKRKECHMNNIFFSIKQRKNKLGIQGREESRCNINQ